MNSPKRTPRANHPPTRVLFIRNIPADLPDEDLVEHCENFGPVTDLLMLRDKRQGFVQFDTDESSVACYNSSKLEPFAPSGEEIEFAYSGRTEITHRSDSAQPVVSSKVLLLIITMVKYPIDVSVISTIFKKLNLPLEKVLIFHKGNSVQVLAQLPNVELAMAAREALDTQTIYAGCNVVRAQFSTIDDLNVTSNGSKSWDWSGEIGADGSYMTVAREGLSIQPVLYVTGLPVGTKEEEVAALFAVYGNVMRVAIQEETSEQPRNLSAFVHMAELSHCRVCEMYLKDLTLSGSRIHLEMASHPYPLNNSTDFSQSPLLFARHKPERTNKTFPPSASLHASNMPDNTTEEELAKVLNSVGGEIKSIRFLDEQHHIAIAVCASVENALVTLMKGCGAFIRTRQLRLGFGHPESNPGLIIDTTMVVSPQAMYVPMMLLPYAD